MKVTKTVGTLTVTAYTDGWPIQVYIADDTPANLDIELKLWGVEQITDLQYALDRIQAQLQPIVKRMNGETT